MNAHVTKRSVAALAMACAAGGIAPLAQAQVEVIYSEIAGDSTADVPGALTAAGAPAGTTWAGMTDLTPNPDGTMWMLRGTTNQPSDESQIMILGAGTAGTMFVQEGQPAPGGAPGEIFNFFDSYPSCGFNNAGDIAFSARIGDGPFPAPNDREAIYTYDAGTGMFTLFLAEGDPLIGLADLPGNPVGDEVLGNSVGAVHLLDDGRIFYTVTGFPSGTLSSLYYPPIVINNGPAFRQPGVDTLVDLFGNTETWGSFDLGDFAITPDGAHWYAQGNFGNGIGNSDDVLSVDDTIVVQEEVLIPGTLVLADIATRTKLTSNGDWYSRGDRLIGASVDGDWALRNGSLVAQTGDGVPGTVGENWLTLLEIVGNAAGSYVIGGTTDNPNPDLNSVIVWEDIGVIMRESDPVDLDGNGMFDDDVFIRSFAGTDFFLGENFQLYFLASLKNAAGDNLGDALMRVPVITANPGDISVTITDAPDPIGNLGDDITYTVRVTNASPSDATNVLVVTTLDLNTPYVSSTLGAEALGVHTANLGTVAGLSVQSYQIVVDTVGFGTVTASTTVSQTEVDPDTGNNTAMASTDITALADLVTTLTDSPDPVITVGGQITYDVLVTNNGPGDANNTIVTLDLDPLSSFVSTTAGGHAAGTVTANLGTIGLGGNAGFQVVVDTSANALYSATATADSDEGDTTPGDAQITAVTDVTIQSDIDVALDDSSEPIVGIGTMFSYTLDLTNNGPTDATGVVWSVTLPTEVDFVSSTAGAHAAGVVSGTEASIVNAGSASITIDVMTNATASPAVASATASPTSPSDDPDLSNNSPSVETRIVLDTSGFAEPILTDANFGLPSSLIPDLPGRSVNGFDRASVSPNEGLYILNVDLDGTTQDEIIATFDAGGFLQTVVQEDVTIIDGFAADPINTRISINDAGAFAFANNTNAPSAIDELIVRGNPDGTFTIIAREGDPAPLATYGGTNEAPNITNAGDVIFLADTTEVATTMDEIVVSSDGTTATLLFREGVTVPAGQDGGTLLTWDEFDSAGSSTHGLMATGDGLHTLIRGDLEASTNDDALVYDNTVVVQENTPLPPPFPDTADSFSPTEGHYLAHNGDWYAIVDDNSNNEGILKNGTVVAITGDPVAPGATELWTTNFEFVAGDCRGNYVVAGDTDADTASDVVVVLNGTSIVTREFEPIDLDQNGAFDDDAFIREFTDDDAIIAAGKLYAVINIRTAASTSNAGDAWVAFDLGICDCEYGGDPATVDVTDLLAFLALWFPGESCADFNRDGTVDVVDLLGFLGCWFPASSGSPCP